MKDGTHNFLFVIIYMPPNFKYFGLKFTLVFLEIIALSIICAYVIVNYFHDNALIALPVSMGIVAVVMSVSIMLLFQTGPVETWHILFDDDEEAKKRLMSDTDD